MQVGFLIGNISESKYFHTLAGHNLGIAFFVCACFVPHSQITNLQTQLLGHSDSIRYEEVNLITRSEYVFRCVIGAVNVECRHICSLVTKDVC